MIDHSVMQRPEVKEMLDKLEGAPRYVFLDATWHVAGYMMRRTKCGLAIEPPVYEASSPLDHAVCGECTKP